MLVQPPIEPAECGGFDVHLSDGERDALRSLPDQLRAVLGTEDPVLGRLFPDAYPDDPELNEEFDQLVHDDLMEERLRRIQTFAETLDAEHLTAEELLAWMGVLNDARLILGTNLSVTEETDVWSVSDEDPQAPAYAFYGFLGWLEEYVVEVLSTGLGKEQA